jgi:hypothetical protein
MDIETTFFSLKGGDITLDFLHDMFSINEKGQRKLEPNTKVVLDEKKLREHNSEILQFKDIETLFGKETTVGRIILNLCLYNLKDTKYKDVKLQSDPYEVEVRNLFTYKNITLNANAMDVIYKELSEKIVNGLISNQVTEQFIDNENWIGFILVPYLNPSMDIKTINAGPEIRKIKNDVLEEHKDIIINNDVKSFNGVIESKVLKEAARILDAQGSTGKIIYDSGVNGTFNNNYKLTALFRGVVPKSDDPTQYKIGLSSLTDGVRKDEIALAGDIAVQGSIGRAISTRQGGYLVKQFNSAFQSLVVDAPGSDCKTPRTLQITLSDKDFGQYEYRYIVDSGKLVQLTKENKSKYVGKPLRLRTPFYCQSTKMCNKCVGDMLYKLGIKNIGLTTAQIGSALMNAALKAFHSLAVKTATYNIEDFTKEI